MDASWLLTALDVQYVIKRPRTLLALGGRGAGKTRLGAEWVNALVRGWQPYASRGERHGRFALVGETHADVREVMIEGPSGILSIGRDDGRKLERPRFEAGRRRLLWANGATAQMFSSDEPDSLRGPQFDAAWCDEAAKWRNAEDVFDMLQFGLRLGDRPRQIVTTTPRATPLVKRLLADRETLVLRSRTDDNAANLAPDFISAVRARYGKSNLGRQELDAELIEEREGALWKRDQIEKIRAEWPDMEDMRRIVVAVDPPASAHKGSDLCGIVAAGLHEDGKVYVLADDSFGPARPQEWARRAVALYHRLEADCLLVEVNQGGDMVSTVIASVDARVPVKPVRARSSKWMRAEPVSMIYDDKVRHAGRFSALEDEMCDFTKSGLSGGRSPDRLDALVWAVGELLGGPEPRVRFV